MSRVAAEEFIVDLERGKGESDRLRHSGWCKVGPVRGKFKGAHDKACVGGSCLFYGA